MSNLHRRQWIQSVSAAGLGCLAAQQWGWAMASPSPAMNASDSLPVQLYKSLNEQQRQQICLPKNHPSRAYVSNWWYIHPRNRIPNTFTSEQQELIKQIFDGMHSNDYRDAVNKQVLIDQYGEKDNAPAAGFFGTPEDEDFEFIFTGHHVTRRCSGLSDRGLGFGGNPIFYGHYPHPESDMRANFNEAKDHPGNPYWYQGKLFNQFVAGLDGRQQSLGLVAGEPRSEEPSDVIKIEQTPKGLPCSELTADQKKLFVDTIRGMLAMFRAEDIDATVTAIEKPGLIDRLHVSWYAGRYDVGSDKVWDTWQIEGPDMVWYFRGYPHIHCYFHLPASSYASNS
ncbi:MAG: DUF3500 domain-containing protein [Pirellula sp.]